MSQESFKDGERRIDISQTRDLEKISPSGQPQHVEEEDFPDGGFKAWLMIAGTACGTFATFGYVNTWGAYYEEHLLRESTPAAIAWIGSLQYALIFLPGVITGRMFDIGYFKTPFVIASAALIVSTILVAECKEYWQFLLCQGIAIGAASGLIFGPTMSIVGHWFRRRRGIAMGITASGTSVGGTIFPILTRELIPKVGFPWTMRILALILLIILALPCLTLERRLPPKRVPGGLFNIKSFKSAPLAIYCAACFVSFLGLYSVLTYIDIGAVRVGVSAKFSFYLVSIANACGMLGRIAGGLAIDRFGAINSLVPMCGATAALTYAWPFARDRASLIAIAVLYGVTCGGVVSTFLLPLYELGDLADIGRRTGMTMSITALGAVVGPPISGAINRASGGYGAVGSYAGTMVLVGAVLMLITRQLVLKGFWGKF